MKYIIDIEKVKCCMFRLTKRKYYAEYKRRFDEMSEKLEEISELKDNWNQYGAKPLSKETIEDFDYFLNKFKKCYSHRKDLIRGSFGIFQLILGYEVSTSGSKNSFRIFSIIPEVSCSKL